jgi:hypothetical protein
VPARLDGLDEIVDGEEPSFADLSELDARVGRGTSGLVPHGMGSLSNGDFVAGARQDPQSGLVRHRPGREEERGLLAEQLGDVVLEPVGRLVFAELVVPNAGLGHGPTHAGSGRVTVSERRSMRTSAAMVALLGRCSGGLRA